MEKSHNHNHVEVMLPVGCSLDYATHAGQFRAPDGHLCLLWGRLPHRVIQVHGEGLIYIANLPLQELLALGLPDAVTEPLLTGELIAADNSKTSDQFHFDSWVSDYESANPAKMGLAHTELQCRLRRQSLDGWQKGRVDDEVRPFQAPRHMHRVHNMIRYMAEHYTQSLTVADIAKSGGVSEGYAMGVFQKVLKLSITTYLTRLRLYHAKSALLESDEKILTIALDSGFGSLSRFYEVFTKDTGCTPQSFRRAARD